MADKDVTAEVLGNWKEIAAVRYRELRLRERIGQMSPKAFLEEWRREPAIPTPTSLPDPTWQAMLLRHAMPRQLAILTSEDLVPLLYCEDARVRMDALRVVGQVQRRKP